ncbi:MAG TPA: glycosyltransferase [Syntrophales bacterium]|nr:glycosyltransferase [Syntrophales bacterium]
MNIIRSLTPRQAAGNALAAGFRSPAVRILIVGAIQGGTVAIGEALAAAMPDAGAQALHLDYSGFAGEFARVRASGDLGETGRFHLLLKTRLLETVLAFRPEAILGIAQSPLQDPQILSQLRQAGIVLAYWFTEDYRLFPYWKTLAPHFDLFFAIQTEPFRRELEAAGCRNFRYLPAAYDRRLPPRSLGDPTPFPLSFVGAPYPNRVHYLSLLGKDSIRIYGEEWDRYGHPGTIVGSRRVTDREAQEVYRRSAVNLNLHSSMVPKDLGTGDFVNPRTFELAGMGCFQISDMRSLLPLHFHPADEVVAVRTWDDMMEAAARYRSATAEREAIAANARRRVLAEHTYQHRAVRILEAIQSLRGDRSAGEVRPVTHRPTRGF